MERFQRSIPKWLPRYQLSSYRRLNRLFRPHLVDDRGHAVRAFLVLGGDGWRLPDDFTSGKLSEHSIHAALVLVVTLEAFN